MEHTVIHDEKVDRFEVFESGQIAYLQYDEKNGVLDILHTIVPPQLEGQGIAQALTEAAVRYASVVGLKIRPTCSFAKMFFTRHTQYKRHVGGVRNKIRHGLYKMPCLIRF